MTTDYELMTMQLREFAKEESDFLPLLSNASALIMASMDRLNWAGFYLIKDGALILGPFQGKPACIRIAVGRGVCGTAFDKDETLRVENVHEFKGHIACDSASNSEIVIPLHHDGKLVGVMDIDSPELSRFSIEDQKGLEAFAAVLDEMADYSSYV
ncbi:GAF domain-containing protein [Butyrivibrio sp. MC2013]|uniref:GAF domain-containing protein n=1 Tax=Butyrivibrio sp. MC2013 TaxID=1280686 RepID=UPI0004063E8C|nr:GAF domain-containing protein [Butyrivibrio sp. MC2013]